MNRNKKKNQYILNVGGVMIEVVTVTGLSRIIGKSRDTVLRYERTDVFPCAPILKGDVRYYPITLAKRLVPIVARFSANKKPDPNLIVLINQIYKEEKEKYAYNKT